jgi:dipeptidyl aminopeptidase/acylaminoacyl peptidase
MTPLDAAVPAAELTAQTGWVFDQVKLVGLNRVVSVAPAPCGTWAAVAVERLNSEGSKYACDLWRVSLPGAEGLPLQLTRGDSRDTSPCFRHDGALGFLSNRATGDKETDSKNDEPVTQVWVLPVQGGDPVRLTNEPFGVSSFKFASGAERMVAVAGVMPGVPFAEQRARAQARKKTGATSRHYTRMPVRYWDHWLPDPAHEAVPHFLLFDSSGEGRRDLTPQAIREHELGDGAAIDISPDGRRAVIVSGQPGPDRIDDTALLIFDFERDSHQLLGHIAASSLDHPLFSGDGKRVACTRQHRSVESISKVELTVFDLPDGGSKAIAEAWDRWPQPVAWSEDGNRIVATADDNGAIGVFEVEAASGKVSRLVDAGVGGAHSNVNAVAGGKTIIGIRSSLLEAPEVFTASLANEAMPVLSTRLSGMTQGFGAGIAKVEKLEVASSDGTPVQYFFLRPLAAKGRLPTLLWIHGGPIGAWNDLWFFRWNALTAVARGYAVVMANPRGSTGFGQDFVQGIWGNVWGAQCYEDLMAVTDAVAARPDVDAARMAAMGGSFGGYMTNWIGANTDRFRCLVTHASVFSMSGFYGDTDIPAWWLLEIGPAPYRDPVSYDRYSPSLRVGNWKTPALIIHGEKDYRVGITQGLTLFECLQQQGVESELLVFPDENHWILKPANSVAWYSAVFDFLGRHLQP